MSPNLLFYLSLLSQERLIVHPVSHFPRLKLSTAAAAAKSLQSCQALPILYLPSLFYVPSKFPVALASNYPWIHLFPPLLLLPLAKYFSLEHCNILLLHSSLFKVTFCQFNLHSAIRGIFVENKFDHIVLLLKKILVDTFYLWYEVQTS